MRRLWILEDQEEVLSILTYFCEGVGFEVGGFHNLKEAWQTFEEALHDPSRLAPHFVISDFRLPDGTSEKWMLKIREQFPSATVLCYAGSINPLVANTLKKYQIVPLEKPEKLSQLLKLVKLCAGQQSYKE